MTPSERASIEAQVCVKAGVELASAEIASGAKGGVTLAIANASAFAEALGDLKSVILESAPVVAQEADPVEQVQKVFSGAEGVAKYNSQESQYIQDNDYTLVHKIFMQEKANGIAYASQDSAFMDNQAVRKLFTNGTRQFPPDYWAETMRGKDIPSTRKGKCALGDFKIKKGVSVDADGTPSLGTGEGNHPLANKSGYFAGLVNNTPFNWPERPAPIDPQGWLVGIA